jgi:hypothetical protein
MGKEPIGDIREGSMRIVSLVIVAILCVPSQSQESKSQEKIWKMVPPGYAPRLQPLELSAVQIGAVRRLLTATYNDSWACGGPDLAEAIKDLQVESLPYQNSANSPKAGHGPGVLLVEPGSGCLRGGQGANAAMWVIDFRSNDPVLIASPADDFSGYFWAVVPVFSHGMPDLVLAWHMSATDNPQTYFKFDGIHYRRIAERD